MRHPRPIIQTPPPYEIVSIWGHCILWSYFSLCVCVCVRMCAQERVRAIERGRKVFAQHLVHLSCTLFSAVPSHALLMQVLQREVCYKESGPLCHTASLRSLNVPNSLEGFLGCEDSVIVHQGFNQNFNQAYRTLLLTNKYILLLFMIT